jgi:hypothetical protein
MLLLKHPSGRETERAYIYDLLLTEFLGVPYAAEVEARSSVCIRLPDRVCPSGSGRLRRFSLSWPAMRPSPAEG